MKALKLERYYTPRGTFGNLYDDTGTLFCHSVEQPWNDNQHDISCIPEGGYLCKMGNFPIHGNTFEVTNVPNRSAILIHAGNTINDVKGCIALGNRFGCVQDNWAVMDSASIPDGAYTKFMRYMSGETEFMLMITHKDFSSATDKP